MKFHISRYNNECYVLWLYVFIFINSALCKSHEHKIHNYVGTWRYNTSSASLDYYVTTQIYMRMIVLPCPVSCIYFVNGTNLGIIVFHMKCVWFYLQLLSLQKFTKILS
jgi:hypothetical protein